MSEPKDHFKFSGKLLALIVQLIISAVFGWLLTFYMFARLAFIRAHVRGDGMLLLAVGCSLVIFILIRSK